MPPDTQRLPAPELEVALSAMREGLQVVDRDLRYVYLNGAAAAHGRRRPEELLGRTMAECYPGIESTELHAALERCLADGKPAAFENVFKYPDGTSRVFELRVEPCPLGLVILSIDVTEGRKVETQFRQAQKMEAIGRLAGSVAHDFNNLLSVILSCAEMMYADLKEVDPMRADVDEIRKAGQQAAQLTRQLLAFSRQQVLAPRRLDLNQLLQATEALLRRLIGEDVELVTSFQPNLSPVRVDPGQIDQVIMNLAVNARDAMPDGGKLTFETGDVWLDEAYTTEHFEVAPGPYVMLAVSDTGVGMDKETQLRIFEPFFTTKEKGKGTGLGLSTVFGIVKQSGGNIWVYSEPGAGTTFKLYFPRASGDDAPPPQPVPLTTLRGSETVLLVEDQDEVRRVARQILHRYGYHVLEARNAGEALLTCERHPRPIHVLVTDVVMPKMNGRELAERLHPLRPEMRVLYMSGYTENTIVHHGILDPGIAYLQKPIVPEALVRRLREVLDTPLKKPGGGMPPVA